MTIKFLINFIYILFIVQIQAEDWRARWERAGVTWSEKWMNTFEQIETYSEEDRIEILGAAARAKSTMRGVKPTDEQFAIGNRAASMLIAISGHAEYFRHKIEKGRAAYKPDEYLGGHDRERHWHFETLSLMPSPETIKVLGDYLSDERDAAKEAMWEPVDYFLIGTFPNSRHASGALKSIGLRDVDFTEPDVGPEPSRNGSGPQAREEYQHALFAYSVAMREAQLKPWLAWYAEVKEGKRSFSFKGQSVEYRFKPDGSWETIAMVNPPDDGPKSRQVAMVEEVRQPKKQRPTESEATRRRADQTPWLWLLTAGCLIVAGGLLAKRIKA